MIGGGMLLCAVGAMIIIAVWSLRYDERPDSVVRDGLLALRYTGEKKLYKVKNGQQEKPAASRKTRGDNEPRQVQQLKRLNFDADEMAEIADEAEETMPKFLRDAHEEY